MNLNTSGGFLMENYQKVEKICDRIEKKFSEKCDEYFQAKEQYEKKYSFSFKGLVQRMNFRMYYQEYKTLRKYYNVYENYASLYKNLSEICGLVDKNFYYLYNCENQILTQETYEQYWKSYQYIKEQLEQVLLWQKKMFLEENRLDEKIDNIISYIKDNLDYYGFKMKRLKNQNDFITEHTSNEQERQNILFNHSLYESIKEYQNIDEILEESLKREYSYDIYLLLTKAFLIFQNERKKYQENEDEKLQYNDFDVIKRKAWDSEVKKEHQKENDQVLDLYSKEQLYAVCELLANTLQKNTEQKDVENTFYGLSNYLKRCTRNK